MAKILCPCGCGEKFEPNRLAQQKYFSEACCNRARQRRWAERQKQKKLQAISRKQRSLAFQPAPAPERRVKGRLPKARSEEVSMFA